MSDDRRPDDDADAPDDHVPQDHGNGRQHDRQDEQLAHLDADGEREQRDAEVAADRLRSVPARTRADCEGEMEKIASPCFTTAHEVATMDT